MLVGSLMWIQAAQLSLSPTNLRLSWDLELCSCCCQVTGSGQKVKVLNIAMPLGPVLPGCLDEPPHWCHHGWQLENSQLIEYWVNAASLLLNLQLLPCCCTCSTCWSDIITTSAQPNPPPDDMQALQIISKENNTVLTDKVLALEVCTNKESKIWLCKP